MMEDGLFEIQIQSAEKRLGEDVVGKLFCLSVCSS
jgi:hypothetical protein